MRTLLFPGLFLLLLGCHKKDQTPDNELPLEQVRGKILYTTGTDLVELDIQSGITKVIPGGKGVHSCSWSPDGNLLLWTDRINSNGALVFKITDAQGNVLLEFDPKDVHEPCWSPDGKKVAFFNYEKKVVTKIDLSTQTLDTFKFNVGNLFWQQGNPDWSPDGKTFVFSAFDLDQGAFDLWRVEVDGSNLLRLTNGGAWYPRWSPDGQEIAFASSQGLRAMSADGNHFRLLLPEGSGPHWSADGTLLMYSVEKTPNMGASGNEIHVRNLETGKERLLVEHASLLYWHPLDG